WQEWQARHRALVVLDDVPDEASVRGLLSRSGKCSVLITARGQLAGLAPVHRIALPALADGEALELLGKLIGAGR
ncbi:AfsR family transcriptional regulator, partial [Streptomyces sp. SID7499]|nr:AfsR family transcriptional regulator [Streptomyces sp. SID7499]